MKTAKKTFLIASLLLGVAMADSQELVKNGSLGGFKGDSKIFSGEVNVTRLFKTNAWQKFGGALVEFQPRARTAWHTHPAGQTLVVTDGVIYTGTESGIVQKAQKGDAILCPPDIKHWHGAGLTQKGAHIALTHEKDGQNVVWLEKLSDEQYEGFIKKAESQIK